MSRYIFTTVKDNKEYEVAYGYDWPLTEYFLQVYDNSLPEDEELILWEGSRMTTKSNSQMLELYQEWNVPKEHCNMLASDLPF